MRYSVLNDGKRIRPVLVYATAQALGSPLSCCDAVACAVELIHAYSLIHDDLPAMDDDQLRRGRPTCHIAFNEATAILAGDALQALAFEVLAKDRHSEASPRHKLEMTAQLASASGVEGMAAGQAIDLASVGKSLSLQELEHMHQLKTGALIQASVTLSALASNSASAEQMAALQEYARCVGLAFQIKDDILDVESDAATMGKNAGADSALNKPTYTSILGLRDAKQHALEQHRKALAALADFDSQADRLRELSAFIIERDK